MKIEEYTAFLKRLGQKIVCIDSVPFTMYRPFCYWSVPKFVPYVVDPRKSRGLLYSHAIMVIHPTTVKEERAMKLCVCEKEHNFDMARIQPRTRTKVRRGLERCRIEPVAWERMANEGLAINEAALRRQNRSSRRLKSHEWWRRQCKVSSEFSDVFAWGAFVNGHLTGYVHVIIHDDVFLRGKSTRIANIAHFMSDSEFLRSYPNEALIYRVTSELFEEHGVSHVVLGNASDDPDLLSWKRHMGYVEEDIPMHMDFNPLLHVFKYISPKLRLYIDRMPTTN